MEKWNRKNDNNQNNFKTRFWRWTMSIDYSENSYRPRRVKINVVCCPRALLSSPPRSALVQPVCYIKSEHSLKGWVWSSCESFVPSLHTLKNNKRPMLHSKNTRMKLSDLASAGGAIIAAGSQPMIDTSLVESMFTWHQAYIIFWVIVIKTNQTLVA